MVDELIKWLESATGLAETLRYCLQCKSAKLWVMTKSYMWHDPWHSIHRHDLIKSISSIVQPIAFGVSFNLNLQSQSHWPLFNGTWAKETWRTRLLIEIWDWRNDTPNAIGCTLRDKAQGLFDINKHLDHRFHLRTQDLSHLSTQNHQIHRTQSNGMPLYASQECQTVGLDPTLLYLWYAPIFYNRHCSNLTQLCTQDLKIGKTQSNAVQQSIRVTTLPYLRCDSWLNYSTHSPHRFDSITDTRSQSWHDTI